MLFARPRVPLGAKINHARWVLLIVLVGFGGHGKPLWAFPIRGLVVEDNTANPLASAEVKIFQINARGVMIADLESDSNGSFELPGLPPAIYSVEVSKANYLSTTMRLDLRNAKPDLLTLRLASCGVISGHVWDSERHPVRSAVIQANYQPSQSDSSRSRGGSEFDHYKVSVNDNGEYRLFGLPPGNYTLAVTYGQSSAVGAPDRSVEAKSLGSGVQYYAPNAQMRIFPFFGGEEYKDVDFVLLPNSLFSLAGKLDLQSSQPGNFQLALTSAGQTGVATSIIRANNDGTFRFDGIPYGSYLLLVSGPALTQGPKGVETTKNTLFGRTEIDVDGNVNDINVQLRKGPSALLALQKSSQGGGRCSRDIQVQLVSLEAWGADLNRSLVVSTAKPGRTENLAPSRYLVTAQDDVGTCYVGETVLDMTAFEDRSITVSAEPSGSIQGRVIADSATTAKLCVLLMGNIASESNQPLRVVAPDLDGGFALGELRPGSYRVGVGRKSREPGAWPIPDIGDVQRIEVKPGSATHLDLQISSETQREE